MNNLDLFLFSAHSALCTVDRSRRMQPACNALALFLMPSLSRSISRGEIYSRALKLAQRACFRRDASPCSWMAATSLQNRYPVITTPAGTLRESIRQSSTRCSGTSRTYGRLKKQSSEGSIFPQRWATRPASPFSIFFKMNASQEAVKGSFQLI